MSKLAKILLFALAIVLAALAAVSGYRIGRQSLYPVAYGDYIIKYANEYKLDPFLVMGVIKQESNFVPDASSGYAHGLMQLTPDTAEWNANEMGLSDYDYLDPETSIKIGCHYLSYLINHYGNVDTALAAYNGGMGHVIEWLNDSDCSSDGVSLDYIPFSETRAYVDKVNGYWEQYRELYG